MQRPSFLHPAAAAHALSRRPPQSMLVQSLNGPSMPVRVCVLNMQMACAFHAGGRRFEPDQRRQLETPASVFSRAVYGFWGAVLQPQLTVEICAEAPR